MLAMKEENRLGTMIAASVLLHAMVIIGLKFSPPDLKKLKDNLPALDVILVNAKSQSRPDKADALAQTNLNRGGNTDADRRMKSPLPVPKTLKPEIAAKPVAETRQATAKVALLEMEATRQQQEVKELEQRVQQTMTQLDAQRAIEQTPTPSAAAKPQVNASDMVARSLEAVRLEAEIAREQDSYQKRPKRKFIGARVREYRFASYVEAWRQKVEKVGNLNYPEEAKAQKLYGQLRMTVSIKADGNVESIEINQSSGQKVLDDAARRIVELAAPYAEFSADMSKDTDILSITRTWTFTREDTLSGL
ncbi:MAG: energy transducer TonB [Methylophilales bacterium RIFCSPHIGHO2_02_FULL_57_10]|nr:MAG: energy transducer TonB [Methylophilales bacterium RIFCSPHIGHO2_02_FULL_57_10]